MAESPTEFGLTLPERQAASKFLERVNRLRYNENKSPLTAADAIKFLTARKFDIEKSLELFENYCKTRIQEDLLYVDPYDPVVQNELNSGKFSILARRDAWTGASIALFSASLHCPLTASHQSVLKGLVFQLDIALESAATQRNGIIFIYDMTDSKYSNFDYDLSVKILHLLKGCYPAKLKKVLIVAAPIWFKAPFKVLQLFVREKLRDRIYTVSIPEISYHVAPESLPSRFGGDLEVNHELWIQHCLQRAKSFRIPSAASASHLSSPLRRIGNGLPGADDVEPAVDAAANLAPYFGAACRVGGDDNRFCDANNHSIDNRSSGVNGIYPLDNKSSNGNDSFFSHGNPPGYLSGRVVGSDIEKFVMEEQEKENGILNGSSTMSRKRSMSSSPPSATPDDVERTLAVDGSQDVAPRLPDKKLKSAMGSNLDSGLTGVASKRIVNGDTASKPALHPALHRGVGTCSLLESSSLEPSIHDVETEGMSLEELVNHVRLKGKRGLMRLYGILRSEDKEGSFVASRYKQNMHKNRYMDVLALDHTRVHLAVQNGDPYSEYINANFVDGYRHKKAFISTQGPLQKTFGDFWRMVWENRTVVVVMTTRCVERSRIKCGRYWPDQGKTAETYDNITVAVKDVKTFNDFVVTELLLTNSCPDGRDPSSSSSSSSCSSSSSSRRVFHLQFLSWPDYGVPLSAGAMLDFAEAVRRHQTRGHEALEADSSAAGDGPAWRGHPDGPPIVIHCSAGIGRTGTFIATDIATRRLSDVGNVDVDRIVRKIRTQRAFSIQMPDQYVFIHQAVLEFAQREGLLSPEAIRLDGFEDDDSDDSQDDSA